MVDENKKKIKEVFLKKPVPFTQKRDINWIAIRNVGFIVVVLLVVGILLIPGTPVEVAFREGEKSPPVEAEALRDGVAENPAARGLRAASGYSSGSTSAGSSTRSRNGSMVISRDGLDPNSQLPPGSRIRVRLLERVVVSSQAMPVIGIVMEDFALEGVVAIPKGSKLYGEVSFDSDAKRGQLSWRSIQIGGARVRQFDALSTSLDGQAGVEGQVHSDALKNTLGQTMTRFVAAYAEGSQERSSFFGGSPGGNKNGMKNAVAETAKEQADRMADSLKKEREWLELKPNQEFFALITQPFRFRDPGGSY